MKGFEPVRVVDLAKEVNELRELLTLELLATTTTEGAGETRDQGEALEQAGASTTTPGQEDSLVLNVRSGIHHSVLAFRDDTPSSGLSRCLWEFEIGETAVQVPQVGSLYKDLCERCFPKLRGSKKQQLIQDLGAPVASGGADSVRDAADRSFSRTRK